MELPEAIRAELERLAQPASHRGAAIGAEGGASTGGEGGAGAGLLVGNDLVHLPAFERMLNPAFIRRVYTAEEKAYCEGFPQPAQRYASTWAAKEAVIKVLGQWDAAVRLSWRKIEILRAAPGGRPRVQLPPGRTWPDIRLTLTHDGDTVWALALAGPA